MKLVEILARELKEWPVDAYYIGQARDGTLHIDNAGENFIRHTDEAFTLSDDFIEGYVTRAQWEAERARIAMNEISDFAQEQENAERARILAESSKLTEQDKEHIAELAAIACGKRSKKDQELWDKVAIEAMRTYMEQPEAIGNVAVEEFVGWGIEVADAFMAERAKRMK